MPPVLLVMRLHIFDYSLIPKREPKPFQPTLDLHCNRNPSQISLEPHWSPSLDHSLRGCNCYSKSFQNHKYCSRKLHTTSKTIFCQIFIHLPMADPIWLEFSSIDLEMEVVSHALAKWITSHRDKDHLRIYIRRWCQKLHAFLFWASGVTGKMW